MKRLILEIIDNDKYFKPADYVILDLNDESIEKIKELSGQTIEAGVPRASISLSCSAAKADYDVDPVDRKVALKEYAGWMDAVHLSVTLNDFCVTGFYGYSDVSWRTDPVPISVLDVEGIYDMREDIA